MRLKMTGGEAYLFSASKKIRQIAIFVALTLCASLLAFFVRAERLPVKTYTVADGLQRDNVSRIRRDSRGFLWFCTAEGISRFDGTAMTNFTVADGLPDRFVNDFLETKSGAIYIATGRGLARLNPHGLRASPDNPLFSVFLPDNKNAARIQTLYEDKTGRVWVGTSDGLYRLNETGGQVAFAAVPLGKPLDETIHVNEILEDRSGRLWIATTKDGLLRLAPNGDVRRFTEKDNLPSNNITALLADRDGQIWLGFRNGGGLCRLDGETGGIKKCYSDKDGLPSNWVTDLLAASDGKFWVTTVSGTCLWLGEGNDSVCKTYATANGLGGAWSIIEDKDENLWTGSSQGATKIARYGFTAYNEADGLDWAKTNSVFENSEGELFVSTNNVTGRTISRFDGDKFSLVKPPLPDYVHYHGWGWQQTVWQDSAGAWWIPTGYGLFRSPDNTSFEDLARARLESVETGLKMEASESRKQSLIQKYSAAKISGMEFYEVFRLFEDSRGDVWIAAANEKLLRWERAVNVWHDYTREAGLSPVRLISAFAEDRDGNVWIGTGSDDSREINEGLLLRYRNGQFQRFTHREGSPAGWIRDLFLDSRGRLWIASTNDGVRRIDETNADVLNFTSYTPANGLTSIATACVTEDEFGRIYIGTWRGVDRLTPETGQVENFTSADGLPAGYVESSYRDRKNNLWFITDSGLARFVPEPVRARKPPNILITGLRVEGLSQSVSILGAAEIPPLDLTSDKRQITVDFLGLGASLGEKLKYEYRFGAGDWTATSERTLNFANLSAGEYRFEVRAQTADGIYSQVPAVVSFRIAAPVWQRWWFLLSAAALVVFIIYLIYKSRLRRLLELEKVRTRIATDLHDDIGANLTRISLLSEVARQKSANGSGELLSSIADIARESVASMNDIVWAIAPEHDSLLDLTRRMRQHAEEVFALREIDLNFNAPVSDLKLSVGVRRDLLLIFKEAVNNAAKHSGCREVWIDFAVEHSFIKLQIEDNGAGFAENHEADGQGLRSMTRRAIAIGGKLTIDSRQERGTIVKFEMNLPKVRQF